MNKKIKILFITCIFWGILAIFSNVQAASATIKASPASVTVGKKSTVTVTVKAAAWNLKVSGSASGSIVGYNGDEKNQTTTKKYTVKPSKAGTYTVKISGDITDANGKETTINKSVKITAKAATTGTSNGSSTSNTSNTSTETKKSSDATLSNLGVTPKQYDFTGFRKSITGSNAEYKVKVPNSVTKLSVYASTSSSKAKYSVSGNTGFKVGTNIISVKVTAEDGTKKTYKIYVTREAEEEEIIPNVTEDEEGTENENELPESEEDIGLESLEIDGYELDSEFQTNILDYKVVIGNDKFSNTDEIKDLIKATSNYEDATVVIKVNEGTEDDYFLYEAIISVADIEREYASYSVKFVESLEAIEEVEEEENIAPEEAVVPEVKEVVEPEEEKSIFEFDNATKKIIIIVCIVLMLIISISLGIIAYAKSSKLKIYEEADEFDDDYLDEVERKNDNIQRDYKEPEENYNRLSEENEDTDVTNSDNQEEKREYYSSNSDRYEPRYRNPRNINRKGGRHF